MLTVVPAVLLVACGAPEAVPVAPAAAVSPATAARTASATTRPLGVVPVDMGPAPAQEVVARVAAQTGNPPARRWQAAPKPAP